MAFVACGNNNTVQTSADGITWTSRTSPFSGNDCTVIGRNGSRFFMGGENGGIAYSDDDGVNWTLVEQNNQGGPAYRGCAGDGSNTICIAGFFNDENDTLKRSTNGGTSFSYVTLPAGLTFISWIHWDGSQFVAGSNSLEIWTSADGSSWSQRTDMDVDTDSTVGIVYDSTNSLYIGTAVNSANGFRVYSTAGLDTSYTERLNVASSSLFQGTPLATNAGTTIAAGRNTDVYRSTNGTSYSSVYSSAGLVYRAAYSAGTWVVTGTSGFIIESSDDGQNWTSRTSAHPTRSMYGLEGTAGAAAATLIAVGNSGQIQKSTDAGSSWATKTAPDSNPYFAVRGTSTAGWVAVARQNVAESGDDGDTWASRTLTGANTSNKFAIDYSGSEWIAGADGQVFRSTDRITWNSHATVNGTDVVRAIVWDGDQFVLVNNDSTVETSTDGQVWAVVGAIASYVGSYEPRNILYDSFGGLYYATTTGNDQDGSGVTLYVSTNLIRWNKVFWTNAGGGTSGSFKAYTVTGVLTLGAADRLYEAIGSGGWTENATLPASLDTVNAIVVDEAGPTWLVFDALGNVSISGNRSSWSTVATAYNGTTGDVNGAGVARDPLPAKPTPGAATQLFSNNAETTLAANLTDVATSITVADGSLFSVPVGNQFELLTIEGGGNVEIVKMTARSGNTLTVVRGQEATAPVAFASGDTISARITAGTMAALQ